MSVKEIFDSMEYGPAPEGAAEAFAWLVDQGSRFGHFIDGGFSEPREGFLSKNPANGETLATLTQATQAEVDAPSRQRARRRGNGRVWAGMVGPSISMRWRVLYRNIRGFSPC